MDDAEIEDIIPDFDFFDENAKISDTGAISDDTFTFSIGRTVRQIRIQRDPLAGTGGLIWPAGEVLARKMCQIGDQLKDKVILELGSGTGILGISVAASIDLGSGSFYMTDLEKVLGPMKRNLALNASPACLQIRPLAWGESVSSELLSADIVLLADCIYLESLFEPLITTLRQVMQPSTIAYLAYKKRRRADVRFFKLLKKYFVYEEIKQLEADMVTGIYLYVVRCKISSETRSA